MLIAALLRCVRCALGWHVWSTLVYDHDRLALQCRDCPAETPGWIVTP